MRLVKLVELRRDSDSQPAIVRNAGLTASKTGSI
jgi:hypothetical protein